MTKDAGSKSSKKVHEKSASSIPEKPLDDVVESVIASVLDFTEAPMESASIPTEAPIPISPHSQPTQTACTSPH